MQSVTVSTGYLYRAATAITVLSLSLSYHVSSVVVADDNSDVASDVAAGCLINRAA